MADVIKLRKGLDINLKAKASMDVTLQVKQAEEYALVPDAFVGVTPKVVVKEGVHVNSGDALFVNKACPEVKFASPVSGTVTAIERGERRKVLCVKVKADAEQQATDFGKKNVDVLDGEAVKNALLEAGLFGYINSCLMLCPLLPTPSLRQFLFLHFATCLWLLTSRRNSKGMRMLSRLV